MATAAEEAKRQAGAPQKKAAPKQTSTKMIFKNRPVEEITEALQQYAGKISILKPEDVGLDTKRFIHIMASIIRSQPQLQDCNPNSVVGAMLGAAMIGLDVTPGRELVAFIPRKIRGVKQCVFDISYQGYIHLAVQSQNVKNVWAHVVYEKDYFEVDYGSRPNIVHKPYAGAEDRGDMIGVYAIWRLADDFLQPYYMPKSEVLDVMQASSAVRAGVNSPWTGPFAHKMWMKSAIRASRSYIALAAKSQKSMHLDDAVIDARATFNKETMDIQPDMVITNASQQAEPEDPYQPQSELDKKDREKKKAQDKAKADGDLFYDTDDTQGEPGDQETGEPH